jgi:fructoselysine-6-P-deglycase FrlB-like protein
VTTVTRPPRSPADVHPDFVSRIESAAKQAGEVNALLATLVGENTSSIFLVGCGGSLFTHAALRTILDRSPVPVYTINSDELVLRRPAMLDKRSLVIVSSSNGATRETAGAARMARELGATVVGITQDPDSVVAAECEYVFLHQGVDAKQVLLAQFGYSILKILGAAPDYDQVVRALAGSPAAFRSAIDETDAQLDAIAQALYQEPVIYVLGSGALEGAAQTFAMCYLQEMQVKHAAAPGSGEFLHGPFEVISPDVPVLVITGEHSSRPMDERVLAFLRRHTPKVHVLDAKDLALPGIEVDMRPLIGTLVVGSALLNRLAEHFEAWSGRPLKDRRYMWKVDY